MQDAGIAAGRDDRAVGRHLRPALAELVVQLGFQAVFVQPGPAGLHGPHVGPRRDVCGSAHHLHFRRRFIQAHVVQQMIQRNELVRRLGAQACLGADHVDPVHQPAVELRVAAHGAVDPLAAFDQARQDLVDIRDGEGIVSAEIAHRPFLAGPQAVPQLALGVAFTAEQHVLAMLAPWNQSNHRLGLREAAEVLEVAVLAVHVLDVAVADGNRGGGQDGDAVGDHLRHQRLAPTGILGLGNVAHGQTTPG
ncbi:hypothetical protein D9M71_339890 [compost metagenome]